MSNRRRQTLYCHNCGEHVAFTIDFDLEGNHIFNCPKCGHEHCRVVKDGRITGERWDRCNGTYQAMYVTITDSDTATYYNDWSIISLNASSNTTTGNYKFCEHQTAAMA